MLKIMKPTNDFKRFDISHGYLIVQVTGTVEEGLSCPRCSENITCVIKSKKLSILFHQRQFYVC